MPVWLFSLLLLDIDPIRGQYPDTACRLAHWNREIAAALEEGDFPRAGHVARTVKGIESLAPTHPERILLEGNLGALQLARGDYSGAIQHFDRASRSGGLAPEALSNWGLALVASGRIRDGRNKLEQARDIVEREGDPSRVAIARANLAMAAIVSGEPRAHDALRQALNYAEHHLGESHRTTQRIRQSYLAVTGPDGSPHSRAR